MSALLLCLRLETLLLYLRAGVGQLRCLRVMHCGRASFCCCICG